MHIATKYGEESRSAGFIKLVEIDRYRYYSLVGIQRKINQKAEL